MSFLSSFFGEKHEVASGDMKDILDLVTYVASLASNPVDIDSSLDTVRGITSRITPGQSLLSDQSERLFEVYFQLETYLTTQDPLRSFTKEELRKRIPEPLLKQLNDHETAHQAVSTQV